MIDEPKLCAVRMLQHLCVYDGPESLLIIDEVL